MRTGISTSELVKQFLEKQKEKGIKFINVDATIISVAKHFQWSNREATKQLQRLIADQCIEIRDYIK